MENTAKSLESAIASGNSNAPGSWSVNSGDGYVQLVWTCDKEDVPEMYGDEPWSEWGGNEIIAASGLGDPDDSGGDSYRDKYDESVISQWVQWNLE